jgi:hypothetical protein
VGPKEIKGDDGKQEGGPQSEEFGREDQKRTSIMANPENGFEAGEEWIEDW